MATLYIRDVADDVAAELKARTAAQGLSLSAYVSAELTRLALRPTNEEVVRRLRARDRRGGPSTAQIVDAVREGRR